VEYETEPIYKLVDARKYPHQRRLLQGLLSTMITQGKVCAQKECSSKGTCVVDQFFFDKDYRNLHYSSIFTKAPCVCDADRMGDDCS